MPDTCCAAGCQNRREKHNGKAFYRIPKDPERRNRWISAIQRLHLQPTIYTRLCSDHFISGKKSDNPLSPDYVPSIFTHTPTLEKNRKIKRLEAFERRRRSIQRTELAKRVPDHGGDPETPPRCNEDHSLEEALQKIRELEELIAASTKPTSPSTTALTINHWCASDDDFKYYTRFPSEQIFCMFWESVVPSATHLVYWSKAQKTSDTAVDPTPSPQRKLLLIDEFFMYCLRVAVGLREKILADLFGVSPSTVSRVIVTWANYLYMVLGTLPIWMSREQVNRSLPQKYRNICPQLRVILDCAEIVCESPSSPTLHPENLSPYKNTNTFKSLLGVAPNGAITFVSHLYAGSVSDKEMIVLSGILDLLEPGDKVMADEGFTTSKMLEDVGAGLIVPPFKHATRFTGEETPQTQTMARLRARVERAVGRVKQYHIWDSRVPLALAGSVNQIWANCCVMANYQGPVSLKD